MFPIAARGGTISVAAGRCIEAAGQAPLSGVVRIRPRDRGGLRSSRADSGPQVLPPARANVPPWLPAKSARVSNLLACCALGPPACAAPCSCHHEACSARSAWPHPRKACHCADCLCLGFIWRISVKLGFFNRAAHDLLPSLCSAAASSALFAFWRQLTSTLRYNHASIAKASLLLASTTCAVVATRADTCRTSNSIMSSLSVIFIVPVTSTSFFMTPPSPFIRNAAHGFTFNSGNALSVLNAR